MSRLSDRSLQIFVDDTDGCGLVAYCQWVWNDGGNFEVIFGDE